MKRSVLAAAALAAALFGSAAQAQTQQTLLLRDPALSASHIAFVYAGDIWVADHNGANPRQLTSDSADETNPVFSPDGSMIAFSANYNDNRDVYVIPVSGGQPKRLTWHPGDDNVLDWAPDGSAVYFASAREFNRGRSAQLYKVSLKGGLPEKQMETRVYRGRFNASGSRFAYDQISPAYDGLYGGFFGWRGYRGGRTPSIMIMDMKAKTAVGIPGEGVNDLEPMWVGDQVYFLSDRDNNKTLNLFRYDPATKAVTRVSNETVWDIRAAYAFGGTIIFEVGGRLKTLDTASGRIAELPISIHPDLPQMRPQMKDASTTIQAFDISPTGKRALITARGEVFTVPVDEGSTRNLTNTDGVREYTALWSPDGARIAYIDAAKAQQVLVIEDQTGLGEAKRLPLGEAFNQLLDWGGDGSRIVYSNQRLELWAITVATGERTLITKSPRRQFNQVDTSPDGRWLAYTESKTSAYRSIRLYDFAAKKSYQVLDQMADASSPVFSKDGKYLYFAASTNSGPALAGLDMSSMEKTYRAALYVAVLAADGESPLKPKPGDEPVGAGNEPAKASPARVDIEGLDRRVQALPIAERNYAGLMTGKNGDLYFLRRPQSGASSGPGGDAADNALMRFNFATKKDEQVLPGVTGARMSNDGWHLIAQTAAGLSTVDIRTPTAAKPLTLTGLKVFIDPRKEWRQMFDEAWLMEKEWFYDPNLHGINWQAIHDRYSPLVQYIGRRDDLNTLLREMLGEMQVGHQFVYGGDGATLLGSANVGLLGADIALENGHTRIKRVYTGENWNPFSRAPLAAPGLNVRDGDYILAINGRALGAGDNIWELMQGAAGKQTVLRIASGPDGKDARNVTVEPVASEGDLRLSAWVEDNRRTVDKASGGRIGYVYVPNTGPGGFAAFNRMYFAQLDKDALIIDDRSNDGGSAANYIVDTLNQQPYAGWIGSAGDTFNTPAGGHFGPKVLLIDQDAQSGGDFLAYAFKQRKVGPLIGTRTWGGLIGVAGNPTLVDGGQALVPWYRFFDADNQWTVEGKGVSPDIRVELDPVATNEGRDTQLQAAIAQVQKMLTAGPPARKNAPTPPPYPTRLGE